MEHSQASLSSLQNIYDHQDLHNPNVNLIEDFSLPDPNLKLIEFDPYNTQRAQVSRKPSKI